MATRIAVGAVFVWLGMVVAISFVEAPLKFRAPGITRQLGVGIGRLVFRALNFCELLLAVVIAAALFTRDDFVSFDVAVTVAIGTLLVQTVLIRPFLARRTAEVLETDERRRSLAHHAYIGCEVVKVIALVVTGALLLGS